MFHVTPASNLPAILKRGLLPRVGERSRDFGEPQPRVYLFPTLTDCDTALGQWLGEWFCDQEDMAGEEVALVVLEVDSAWLPLETAVTEVAFEVAIPERIPPCAIVRVWSEKEVGREAFHQRRAERVSV